MCKPGRPCNTVLDTVRPLLAEKITMALSDLIAEAALISVYRLNPDQLRHLVAVHGSVDAGALDITASGRDIAFALLAERLPEVAGQNAAIREVRAVLMRRVFNKHGDYLGAYPEA